MGMYLGKALAPAGGAGAAVARAMAACSCGRLARPWNTARLRMMVYTRLELPAHVPHYIYVGDSFFSTLYLQPHSFHPRFMCSLC